MVVDDDRGGKAHFSFGSFESCPWLWTSHFDFAFSESDSLEGLGARLLRFLVEKESKEKNAMAVDADNQATKQLPR